MPAPIDVESDRPSINSQTADVYSPDFFDGLCQKQQFLSN